MQKQITRLEQSFNLTLEELQKDLEKAQAALNNVHGEFAFSYLLNRNFSPCHISNGITSDFKIR